MFYPHPSFHVGQQVQRYVLFTQELDYTFVGVTEKDVIDLREYQVTPIDLNQPRLAAEVGAVIHIPQHPGGRQKRLSYSTVLKITGREVFYKADTAIGSSGSPVLYVQNNRMYALALHKDGGVSVDSTLANRGILISTILDHVYKNSGEWRFILVSSLEIYESYSY